jgi:hypothetical protein
MYEIHSLLICLLDTKKSVFTHTHHTHIYILSLNNDEIEKKTEREREREDDENGCLFFQNARARTVAVGE